MFSNFWPIYHKSLVLQIQPYLSIRLTILFPPKDKNISFPWFLLFSILTSNYGTMYSVSSHDKLKLVHRGTCNHRVLLYQQRSKQDQEQKLKISWKFEACDPLFILAESLNWRLFYDSFKLTIFSGYLATQIKQLIWWDLSEDWPNLLQNYIHE